MRDARDMKKHGQSCGVPLKLGRGDCGLVLSSHGRKEGSCKSKNEAEKGKSCRTEGGLLLLLTSAEKNEGRGLELENI